MHRRSTLQNSDKGEGQPQPLQVVASGNGGQMQG